MTPPTTQAADRTAPDLGLMVAAIGATVRQLRKEAGLTLEQLAERGDLSVGIVSQLERGKGNPSFATLVQIAHGLGVPVGRLLLIEDAPSPVVRADQRRRVDGHGIPADNIVYEMLTSDLSGALQATWVHSWPGNNSSATPFVHHGEEFGVVISGQLEVHVDSTTYLLGPGDSIRYSSTVPHWFVNPGPLPVDAVWVSTPPTW
jgi:transcriptional regulator with XRE-family HTH domain